MLCNCLLDLLTQDLKEESREYRERQLEKQLGGGKLCGKNCSSVGLEKSEK